MNKSLIIYSPGALQSYGHAYDYASGLGEGFTALGYQVHVIAHEGPLQLSSDLIVHSVSSDFPVFQFVPAQLRRHAKRLVAEPTLLRLLASVVSEHPDAPVLFETFEYFSCAHFLGKAVGMKAAAIFHSTTFKSESDGLLRTAYKRASTRSARTIANSVAVVFVHGNRMRERLIEELGLDSTVNVQVLPHGAPKPESIPSLEREKCRAAAGLPDGNLILSFGTLRRDKDFSTLFRAVAQAEGWTVVHAGPEGDLTYAELETAAQRCGLDPQRMVLHRRFIPGSEHHFYFGSADLVAAFYDPRMTHESGTAKRVRSFGRLLLASGPDDLVEYVREWQAGYVVAPNDPVAAAKILKEYGDLSEVEKSAREERVKDAARALCWEEVARRIDAFLAS